MLWPIISASPVPYNARASGNEQPWSILYRPGAVLRIDLSSDCFMGRVTGLIGTTGSHYRVIGKLGVGGMGIVYDAEDVRLPRRVALKFLPDELADDPDSTRRLEREAQTIALLNHPNICTIHEIDQHEGRTFIVMERLEGLNLKAHMAKQTLETRRSSTLPLQITEALEVAHGKGIIHRDIKPGNIFVGSDRQVKVLDFGLARRVPTTTDSTAPIPNGSTIPGRPLGTASYMAPERILQMRLDGRCDLFSLGVVMYEMATGRLPFTAPPQARRLPTFWRNSRRR